MRPASEADLVVSLALRAADVLHRSDRAAWERLVVAAAKRTGEEALRWARAMRTDASPAGSGVAGSADRATVDQEVRDDAGEARALADALAEWGWAGREEPGRLPAPTGVVVVAPERHGGATDVVGAVLGALAGGGAVVIVAHPALPAPTRAVVTALAAAVEEAGGPVGAVQCVEGAVGAPVTADARVSVVVGPRAPGVVPVVAGPDTDPVALARLLLADGTRRPGAGSSTPGVLIAPAALLDALASASPGLRVLDGDEVAAVRSALCADPDGADGPGRDEVGRPFPRGAGGDAWPVVAAGVRLLVAPVPALVPEEPLARPHRRPIIVAVAVEDPARAGRAVAAAVRVAGGPGPVLAVHGSAWCHHVALVAAAAGFARVVVDGSTIPVDPIDAARFRPSDVERWTRLVGWSGALPPAPGPTGPQPPYPVASNRDPT